MRDTHERVRAYHQNRKDRHDESVGEKRHIERQAVDRDRREVERFAEREIHSDDDRPVVLEGTHTEVFFP